MRVIKEDYKSMREEILYTPEEIGQKLKLSKYTVYEMIKKGEMPSYRIGRSLRISKSQYDKYLLNSVHSVNYFKAEVTIDSEGEKIARIKGISKDVDIFVTTDLEGTVKVEIKPENVILSRNTMECSARNNIEGVITGIEENSLDCRITVNIGVPLTVTVTKKSVEDMELKVGDTVYTVFKASSVIVV